MKVHELIKELEKMPPFQEVYTDNGEYLEKPDHVELDGRDYVIIRNS